MKYRGVQSEGSDQIGSGEAFGQMPQAERRLRATGLVLLIVLINVYATSPHAQTFEIKPSWVYPIRGVVHVAVSSDGRYIGAGSSDTGLYLLNNRGAQIWKQGYNPPPGQQGMKSVAISSDGQYLAAGQDDEGGKDPAGVYLFDRNSSIPLWRNESGDIVWSVGISSDGQYVAAGGWYLNRRVQLFSRESGTPLWSYSAGLGIKSVAISSDGQYIAAGSDDQRLYVFNRESPTPLWSCTQDGYVETVAISSDSEYVVAGSAGSSVAFFRRDTATPLWANQIGVPLSVAVSSDGQYIAAGTGGPTYGVYLFNRENQTLWTYQTGSNVESVAISPDGKYIAAGGDDHTVYLFGRDNKVPLWEYHIEHTVEPVFSVAIPSNASSIVVAGGAGDVLFFNESDQSGSVATTTTPSAPFIPQPITDFFRDIARDVIITILATVIISAVGAKVHISRRRARNSKKRKRSPDELKQAQVATGYSNHDSPKLMVTKMIDDDERFMRRAIEESKKSRDENDGRVHPQVGVVVVRDGKILVTAYRGEIALGDHAEYTALERKLPSTDLNGATIYTTLEPCTSRAHKTPCVDRIIQRKIARVVIGVVDPNPAIIGGSVGKLKTAGIEVSFAMHALETEIKVLNKSFLEAQMKMASKETGTTVSEQFERRLGQILIPHGEEVGPNAQILVGPVTMADDYLRASSENAALFSFTPSFLAIQTSTPRRDRYQFKSYDNLIRLEVYVDGYFHARFPIPNKNSEVLLGAIVFRIASFLFYAVRILKMRKVTTRQRIHVELAGFRNIEVALSSLRLRLQRYYFPADRDETVFEYDFDPSESWKTIFSAACAIYHDILLEVGITDVSEDRVLEALKSLVKEDADLRTEYSLASGERVPRIDLKDLFG